jgi:hypothetical protein
VPMETSTSELPATASTQSVDPPHAGQSETVEPTPTSETVPPPTTPAALPTVTNSRIADDTPPPTRTVARIPDGQRDPAAVASPPQPATNDALPPTTTTSPVATPLQRATESADLPRTHEIVAEPETAVGVVEQTGSVEADLHRPDMAGSSPLAPEPAAPIAMPTDVQPGAAARSDIRKRPTSTPPAVQRRGPEHASVRHPEAPSNSVIRNRCRQVNSSRMHPTTMTAVASRSVTTSGAEMPCRRRSAPHSRA